LDGSANVIWLNGCSWVDHEQREPHYRLCLAYCPGLRLLSSPPAPAPTSFISGRIVDDSARGLVGAEVILLASQLKAFTGRDGQFRLERVPLGPRSILVRAIGFLPYSRVVNVESRGVSLGVVTLHAAVTLLPEIEVTGKIPTPAFGLGFGTNLESGANCPWCGRPINYLPFGASMTEDGLYLALSQRFGKNAPPSLDFRERPVGLSGFSFQFRWIQCNRKSRPVATRIDGATARVLYSTGAVWLERLERWSDECFQAITLRLDGVPLGAAPLAMGWIVAVEDSAGLTHLRRFNDFGRLFWTIPLATILGSTKQVKNVILAPASLGVTVSLTESPFSWAVVDSAGSVLLQSSPFTAQTGDTVLERLELEKWKGFAVLPVKDGFIQTLESPRPQQGMFVLYNVVGRPVKVMRRFGASVLIASRPKMRMLLGYQYNSPWGGSSRLFMYRY
jgi:hypothetical protein